MNRDIAAQILRDYGALRQPGTDPELAAIRAAILLEDVFGITLPDAEIDPAVLTGPAALAAVAARLREAP